jgi:hypothetical protein
MVGDPIYTHLTNGHRVDLWHLEPADIRLEEICIRLSRLCRYTGALPVFYSVADHSRNLARYFALEHEGQPNDALHQGKVAALTHDMAEAYVGDLLGPIKHGLCLDFMRLETVVESAIVATLCPGTTFEMLARPHAALTRAEMATLGKAGIVDSELFSFDTYCTMEDSAEGMIQMCRAVGIKEGGKV